MTDRESIVSVCLITYNHEPYLQTAIDSVIFQKTSFPFELVIGEDCSTDKTWKICEEYVQKHPDIIRLLPSKENLGVMPNFIRTLQACKGKYIALCEGDDYWIDPYKLQKQVDFLEKNNNCYMVVHDTIVVDTEGNVSHKRNRVNFAEDEKYKMLSFEEIAGAAVIPFHTSSVVFRNIKYNLPGFFNRVVNGDYYLFSTIALKGEVVCLKECMSAYRKNPASVTQNYKYNYAFYRKIISDLKKFEKFAGQDNAYVIRKKIKAEKAFKSLQLFKRKKWYDLMRYWFAFVGFINRKHINYTFKDALWYFKTNY